MTALDEGLALLTVALSKFDAYADEVEATDDDATYSLVVESMNGIQERSASLLALARLQGAQGCSR